MSRSSTRRAALLTLLLPVVTAGIVATAGPATAIPFEGDPTPGSTCLRLVELPGAGPAGDILFVSHRFVLVLSSDC